MTQYGSNRFKLSFGEQFLTDRTTLTGASVTTSTKVITGLSGLTASRYDGMRMFVLSGTNAGKVYHVTSNATNSITIQEATAGFAGTDNVVFELRKVAPSVRNVFLNVCEDFDFPTPTFELEELYSHNSGQDRNTVAAKRMTLNCNVPLVIQDMRFPFELFGMEATTGSTDAGGGNTTMSVASYIGETVLTVNSTSSFNTTNHAYVQVDTGGSAEVRKIASVGTGTLTLDAPLRIAHNQTTAVTNKIAPYTHTITCNSELPGFDIVGTYDEATDFVRDALWSKVVGAEFASEAGDLLKFSADILSSSCITTGSIPTVTNVTTDPLQYRMVSGGITLNSVVYATVEQFRYRLDRGTDALYSHQDITGNKPFLLIEGRRKHQVDMVIAPGNSNIYDLLDGSTTFTISVPFVRTAATDTVTFTFASALISAAPHGFPLDGAVKVPVTMHPGSLTSIVVVDSIPYYPSGS